MATASSIYTVSLFRFYLNARSILKNPLPFHHRNFERSGGTFRIRLGFGKPVIFSRNPDFAKYVLQTHHRNYQKSPIQTRDMAKYLGSGLLTAEGETWKKQRKLLQPAFHKKQLVHLLDTMHRVVGSELDRIPTKMVYPVFPLFNDLAFQVVIQSLFSGAANQEQIDRLQFITESAQKMLVQELRQPYKRWWFRLTGKVDHHLELTREARNMLKGLVTERKGQVRTEKDLLDLLLNATYDTGEKMTGKQLLDEILILFMAGHETASNALTFTSALLAAHPKYQERILEEVIRAEETTENLMDFIRSCPLITNVVQESLRLYPPVYFIDRMNKEEDQFGALTIPAGSSVLFSIYEIHRDPQRWEDPERFYPERFDNGDFSDRFFPFGAGPRKCIGNNFAMYEMILCVAEMVKKFRISGQQMPVGIQPLITLKPKDVNLIFDER